MTEKMFGDYSSSDGTLNILVTNFKEFESLINKAKKQADELQKTINQLEFFNWHFKFTIDKDNQLPSIILSALTADISESMKETIAFINSTKLSIL